MMRIGQGYDMHRLGEGDAVVLGGVRIAHCQGLIAHSDGDVLLHALCDALLGAAALGDIGKYFPDDQAQYAKADSRVLLRQVVQTVHQQGYQVVNVDMTVIAQAPKIADYTKQMQHLVASDLSVEPKQVSIKATTTEGLGVTGRQEGIAAMAIALIQDIQA